MWRQSADTVVPVKRSRVRRRVYDSDPVVMAVAWLGGIYVSLDVRKVIEQADVVIIAASNNPLASPDEPFILTGEMIDHIKKDAVIVNAGSRYAVDKPYLQRRSTCVMPWVDWTRGQGIGRTYHLASP